MPCTGLIMCTFIPHQADACPGHDQAESWTVNDILRHFGRAYLKKYKDRMSADQIKALKPCHSVALRLRVASSSAARIARSSIKCQGHAVIVTVQLAKALKPRLG